MTQPLSARLPDGVRFLPHPLPAAPSAIALRRAYPEGRTTGLPRSTDGSPMVRALPLRRWLGQRRQEIGGAPCTWPRTVWFKPISAFGLLDLTTFISSSPELALPSTLAPDRLGASSRRFPSREDRPPRWGEVTLSQELRTARLLQPHVLVGYRWSHTGLCPDKPVITGPFVASCRTPLRTGRESCPSSSSSLHERPSRDAAAFVRLSRTWICR